MKARNSSGQKASIIPARRRNAIETKHAILLSARAAFARSGYDGVGVREIAKAAGVTGILVNRYFGSKEQLFSEVIASTMAEPGILTSEALAPGRDAGGVSRAIATALVSKTSPEAAQLDGFLILLRSASNERAASIWREQVGRHYERSLASRLSGSRNKERAGLILALIAGFQIMRQAIGAASLSQANPEWLVDQLAGLFECLTAGKTPFA
jgi:AcrR family transcriptional regulator